MPASARGPSPAISSRLSTTTSRQLRLRAVPFGAADLLLQPLVQLGGPGPVDHARTARVLRELSKLEVSSPAAMPSSCPQCTAGRYPFRPARIMHPAGGRSPGLPAPRSVSRPLLHLALPMLRELTVENLLLIERARLRAGPGAERAHRRDRRRQDRARARARPAARRPRPCRDRAPRRAGGLRRGHLRPAARTCARGSPRSWPSGSTAAGRDRARAPRLGADGRTRAYVNGRSATVADLRDAGGLLLSFYGQHEHRKLTVAAAQLADPRRRCAAPRTSAGCAACADARARVRARWASAWRSCASSPAQRERELGLLEFELGEIDAARARRRRARAAARRARAAAPRRRAAGGGRRRRGRARSPARTARRRRRRSCWRGAAAALDGGRGRRPGARRLAERLRGAGDRVPGAGGRAARLRERAARGRGPRRAGRRADARGASKSGSTALERLLRKHGGSVEAVLEFAAGARARHEELAGAEVAIDERRARARAGARASWTGTSPRSRAARRKAAPPLREGGREQLALAGDGATPSFEVELGEARAGPARRRRGRVPDRPQPGRARRARCARSPPAASSRA